MASVKLYPRLDKPNQAGEVPIYLRVTKDRKSRYVALGVYIQPGDWNAQTGKVKPGATNAIQINYYLATKEAEAESIALEMETRSKYVSSIDIKSRIMGKPPADFFAFAEKYGESMRTEWSVGNYRKFLSVLTKLRTYNHAKPLHFDEVNVAFIRDYQSYLLEELGNKLNTIHANLKVLRRVIMEAIIEELIPYEKNPFLRIKMKAEKSHRLYLLDEELGKLKKVQLPTNSKIQCHRDMYLFSATAGGIRISDMLMMRWLNFDGTHLCFRMKKTQEDIRVKLPNESLEIIQCYHRLAASKHPERKVNKKAFIFPAIKLDPNELDRMKTHLAISAATAHTQIRI